MFSVADQSRYFSTWMMSFNENSIALCKENLSSLLDMKDLGSLSMFLGVSFKSGEGGATLDQQHYIRTILQRFGMGNCNPVTSPML